MKNKNLLAIILAIPFLAITFGSSAKEFKGVITYKVSVTGSSVTDEVKAMMPKTMTLTIKGNKSRSEMVMGMGTTISISDGDAKTSIALLDMFGQKMAIKTTREEIEQEMDKAPDYTVETSDETKDILGYTCKKATIKSQEGMEIIVYYTDELGDGSTYFDDAQFRDIKGIMLQFEIPQEDMNMKFTATNIEKKNVSDSEFEIPEDYQVKTKDEVKGMFGGGM